jgi:hypothetical protein
MSVVPQSPRWARSRIACFCAGSPPGFDRWHSRFVARAEDTSAIAAARRRIERLVPKAAQFAVETISAPHGEKFSKSSAGRVLFSGAIGE